MNKDAQYRLEGLEPDNLLAFLSLLGLLRAIELSDGSRPSSDRLTPRVSWDVTNAPIRPRLHLVDHVAQEQISARAAEGLDQLVEFHSFGSNKDLNHSREVARSTLVLSVAESSAGHRYRADLLAALMTDAAVKTGKNEQVVDPTPLCLLFGQGHQHFLERLSAVPRQVAPPPRGKGKKAIKLTATECISEALFSSWHRDDPTHGFRWDPEEDVRYALMPGDPTAAAYKGGTQHGANRLAALGLATLTVVPQRRGDRVRPGILGGTTESGVFSLAWPIWHPPATLEAIRALLSHPNLRNPEALYNLGVDQVMVARRVSVGKFMNFTRATVRLPTTSTAVHQVRRK